MTALNIILIICVVFLIVSILLLRMRYRNDFARLSGHFAVIQYTQLNEFFNTVYENSDHDEKLIGELKKAASQVKPILGGVEIESIIDTVVLNSSQVDII